MRTTDSAQDEKWVVKQRIADSGNSEVVCDWNDKIEGMLGVLHY